MMSADRVYGVLTQLTHRARLIHGKGAEASLVAFSVSSALLRERLGEEWAQRNLFRSVGRGDSFFDLGQPDSEDRRRYLKRVVSLAELLLNLREVPGAPQRFDRLGSVDLEAAIVELEGAALLRMGGVRFEFVREQGERGADYDVDIHVTDEVVVACEMKCKKLTTVPSEQSLRNSLQKARRQLPGAYPGLVFLSLPEAWMEPAPPDWLHTVVSEALRASTRLTAVVIMWEAWAKLPDGTRISGLLWRHFLNPASEHAGLVRREVLEAMGLSPRKDEWIDLLRVSAWPQRAGGPAA